MNIGEGLKQQRLKQGRTQAQVADIMDISVSSVRNMEKDNPHVLFRRYMQYAEVLDLKIEFKLKDLP